MKKISKLFLSFILVALCACSIIPFAGCGEPDWQEVQSVQYNRHGVTQTASSRCVWEIIKEPTTRTEYESAPEGNKVEWKFWDYLSMQEDIEANRQEFINYANSKVGKVCYTSYQYSYNIVYYYKATYKSYELNYIKVNILENDSIEIRLLDGTIRKISPSENGYLNDSDLPYKITYFIN